jgi:hypothetical protein
VASRQPDATGVLQHDPFQLAPTTHPVFPHYESAAGVDASGTRRAYFDCDDDGIRVGVFEGSPP